MPYRFLEDEALADVAFEVRAGTLEELFAEAARALTNAMIEDLAALRLTEQRTFRVAAESVEMLLFQFLQELVFLKDVDQLLFREYQLQVRHGDGYEAAVTVQGEMVDPQRHPLRVDVKAVTLHRFEVRQRNGVWWAHVILDI